MQIAQELEALRPFLARDRRGRAEHMSKRPQGWIRFLDGVFQAEAFAADLDRSDLRFGELTVETLRRLGAADSASVISVTSNIDSGMYPIGGVPELFRWPVVALFVVCAPGRMALFKGETGPIRLLRRNP